MVGEMGYDPTTSKLKVSCSIHLSYSPVIWSSATVLNCVLSGKSRVHHLNACRSDCVLNFLSCANHLPYNGEGDDTSVC